MMHDKPNIFQVSFLFRKGGAHLVGDLHDVYQQRGLNSWILTKEQTDEPNIFMVNPRIPENRFYKGLDKFEDNLTLYVPRIMGLNPARALTKVWGQLINLHHWLIEMTGQEDLQWSGAKQLLSYPPQPPDILHFSFLHGYFFDIRQIPKLTRQIPSIITLQDTWYFTGHCAYYIDCERWRTGCGNCPDLEIYPALRRDGTSFNYQRKQKIYRNSRYYVTAPSQWLLDDAQNSILAEGAVDFRLVRNGIDLDTFTLGDKAQCRERLGLPQDEVILLYVASNNLKTNPFKDYTTIRSAIEHIKNIMPDQKITFIGVGTAAPTEKYNNLTLEFHPYQDDRNIVADYFRAADIFLHAARAEAAGMTLTEAQACGTPVIATAVGGIPEQLQDGVTGYLVPRGDGEAMAAKIQHMLTTPHLLEEFGVQAVKFTNQYFGLKAMADSYLAIYKEALDNKHKLIK